MGEVHAAQEPGQVDYLAAEDDERKRDDVEDEAEAVRRVSTGWLSLMPPELRDKTITRNIICQCMMILR
jgi:hypothetical protein